MHTKKQLKILSEYFEWDFSRKPEPFEGKKNPDKDLMVADVHCPFHHKEFLKKTIDDNLDAANLWVAGDWWDFYSKSFYRKEVDIDFRVEFREGFAQLWKLSSQFEKIYVMLSNHDMRFTKWLYDNAPVQALPFLDYNAPERLLKTIPNLRIIKQLSERGREVEYIYQHRNMVITHIELSRKNVSLVSQELVKELYRWKDTFKLKPYDMLIQAHNHQSSRVRWGNKFLFQIPCLIDISQPSFNYVFRGKLQGNPPALGYIVLKKENGLYDPKKSYIVDY